MVGFPTETEEDFQKSKRLLRDLRFDSVEVYPFSSLSGLDASTMEGQVQQDDKNSRCRQLFFRPWFQHPYRKLKQMLCSYR